MCIRTDQCGRPGLCKPLFSLFCLSPALALDFFSLLSCRSSSGTRRTQCRLPSSKNSVRGKSRTLTDSDDGGGGDGGDDGWLMGWNDDRSETRDSLLLFPLFYFRYNRPSSPTTTWHLSTDISSCARRRRRSRRIEEVDEVEYVDTRSCLLVLETSNWQI